jgi:hypothetical protein
MLPQIARDMLIYDIEDAEKLAAAGDAPAGYEALTEGLGRARAAESAGYGWAPDLVRGYEAALAEFSRRHGVKVE